MKKKIEYYNEILKVEIFQGRNINLEKNPSSRWDLNLRPSVNLAGCSNHWFYVC